MTIRDKSNSLIKKETAPIEVDAASLKTDGNDFDYPITITGQLPPTPYPGQPIIINAPGVILNADNPHKSLLKIKTTNDIFVRAGERYPHISLDVVGQQKSIVIDAVPESAKLSNAGGYIFVGRSNIEKGVQTFEGGTIKPLARLEAQQVWHGNFDHDAHVAITASQKQLLVDEPLSVKDSFLFPPKEGKFITYERAAITPHER